MFKVLSLSEFVGQDKVVDALSVFIKAAKERDEMLDHVVLHGYPGLGKTTLANIVASEMETESKIISAPAINKISDIAAVLTNITERSVVFIDEIHRLSSSVEECLYSAMDSFVFDIVVGDGVAARTIKIDLPKFTLIGATTRLGMISRPLRDRFSIQLGLSLYDDQALSLIIREYAKSVDINICEDAIKDIVKRSRGTPRISIGIMKRIRDFAQINRVDKIDSSHCLKFLSALGIDNKGLNSSDRKYLEFVYMYRTERAVGINTIAASINEQKGTIEDVIEPYLLRIGFIKKTSQGRVITELGIKHIDSSEYILDSSKNK